jgi:hypothetical protein
MKLNFYKNLLIICYRSLEWLTSDNLKTSLICNWRGYLSYKHYVGDHQFGPVKSHIDLTNHSRKRVTPSYYLNIAYST